MQVVGLVLGILAIVGMMIAFIPCLGWLNWLNIPFSAIGLIISIIALATTKQGSKGMAIAGVVLCAIAIGLGLLRLIAGGGVV